MDNREYYRLLGLQEGASQAQIRAAYEEKHRKLDSADYADDPEYVNRKCRQLEEAYRILTGSAAPATQAQKRARFERWKDAEDSGEDAVESARRKLRHHHEGGFAEKPLPKNTEGKQRRLRHPAILILILVVIVLVSILVGYIPNYLAGVREPASESTSLLPSDPGSDDLEMLDQTDRAREAAEYQEAVEHADRIREAVEDGIFDYSAHLRLEDRYRYENLVRWELDEDREAEVWDHLWDLTDALGFSGIESGVDAAAGEQDFYFNHDDLENAAVVAQLMGAPDFEDVAGGMNLYYDELILDYNDYIQFLCDVAGEQGAALRDEA